MADVSRVAEASPSRLVPPTHDEELELDDAASTSSAEEALDYAREARDLPRSLGSPASASTSRASVVDDVVLPADSARVPRARPGDAFPPAAPRDPPRRRRPVGASFELRRATLPRGGDARRGTARRVPRHPSRRPLATRLRRTRRVSLQKSHLHLHERVRHRRPAHVPRGGGGGGGGGEGARPRSSTRRRRRRRERTSTVGRRVPNHRRTFGDRLALGRALRR